MPKKVFLFGSYNSAVYFTDIYGVPHTAFSLRKLSPTSVYSGACIRVRRSSDNAEQDINFVSSAVSSPIDTSALISFVGANNGFVTTWYNQGSSTNNATQTSASAQPQIVSSGAVISMNALTSIKLLSQYWNLSNFSTFNDTTIFMVQGDSTFGGGAYDNTRFIDLKDGTNSVQFIRDGATNRNLASNSLWQPSGNATSFITQPAPTAQKIYSLLALNGNNDLNINASLQSEGGILTANPGGTIGKIGQRGDLQGTCFMNGEFQELIVYQTNKSSSLSAIATNLNNYYNVF